MRAGLKSSSRSPSPRDQRQSRSPQANTGTTTDEEYLGTFSSPSADYEQTAGSDDADDGDLELDFSPAPVSDEAVRQGLQSRQPWQPSFPLCYSRVSAFHWVRSDSISALSCHRRR